MANELIIKNGLIVDSGGIQVTGSTTSTQGFIKPGASNQYLLADGTTTTGPASPFPYTGSALITGSLIITGSLDVTQGITGSLLGTASYANTASFVLFDGLENYVAMFTSNNDLTSSNIYVTESGVSINTTSSNAALTVNSTNISRDALQIQITGSTYFAVNNEGVMVLSPFYNTPTAISGGFIYSASGEYFIGVP